MHGMTSEVAGPIGPRDRYDEPVAPTRDDPFVAGVRFAGDASFAASVDALDILAADVLPLLDRR